MMNKINMIVISVTARYTGSGSSTSSASGAAGKMQIRVLKPNENVFKVQSRWKSMGRFVLENRKDAMQTTLEKVRQFIAQLETAKQRAETEAQLQKSIYYKNKARSQTQSPAK